MNTTLLSVLSALGGLLGGAATAAGVVFTHRQAVKANRVTAAIEEDKVAADAYAEARKIWDSAINAMRGEITRMQAQLDDLAQKRAGDRLAIHILAQYARDLLKVINKQGLTPPPPPEGLDLEG